MPEKECDYCKLGASRLKMFEDDVFVVVLHPRPSFQGHTLIIPKKHTNILEQIPDKDISRMFFLANKVSSSLFESLNIQGTNILIENGIAAGQDQSHVSMHIIPRVDGDKVGLVWQTKTLDEEQMSTVELTIKEEVGRTAFVDKDTASVQEAKRHTDIKPKQMKHDEENYLIKSLTRIP